MVGGQPLRLGPFIGGLNTGSDPTAIADAELATSTNFELDIDGSLVSRPPFVEINGHGGWTERIVCLGEAVFGDNHYVIGSNVDGVYHYLNGVWTIIKTNFWAAAAVQYADAVYLIGHPLSGSTGGGKWSPSGGYTPLTTIPLGQAAVIHKERLFVVPGIDSLTNTSRLTFSNVGDFETWDASDFIDISQGDGSKLVDLTVFQDNLLLFKNYTTWVLAYDIRPSDAVVRKISLTIGANKQHCVVNYENQVYIFHEGWVYEIINYDFNRLNTKVPFVKDQTSPSSFSSETTFLSLIADKLICRLFNRIYVYGLRTRTWSEWSSSRDKLHYFGPIVTIHPSTGTEHYAGSCLTSNITLIKILDTQNSSDVEETINPEPDITDTFTRSETASWGSVDNIAWDAGGGSASDFSVNGTQGIVDNNTINTVRTVLLNTTRDDGEITADIAVDQLASGGWFYMGVIFRSADVSNYYVARLVFKDTSNVVDVHVSKRVAGTLSSITADIRVADTFVAGDIFKIRVNFSGSDIKVRAWKSSDVEPNTWTLTVTDSEFTTGIVGTYSYLSTSVTNTLPVKTTYDNFSVADIENTSTIITCMAKTKNFDMAISHQFKRLWWWGADISSDNGVTGIATPIVLSFNATWESLENLTWEELNTWAQPTEAPSSIETDVATGTGTDRRFIKFLKALRYRQINFQVNLTTDGSTSDGPARLFTMLIITESKQAVSKAVS